MKKIIILIIVAISLSSCEKKAIKEYINTNKIEDIAKLRLYGNAQRMFVNGDSELTLNARAFGEIEVVDQVVDGITGELKDTVIIKEFSFIKGRLSEDLIKIYTEDGQEVTNNKFTTTSSLDSMRFYAEAGSVQSDLFRVKLLPPPENSFQPITVPVIFHILATDKTRVNCSFIDHDFLKAKIDRLNKVFAAQLFNSPNSVDLKVTFELAEQTPTGEDLEEIGINREDLGDNTYRDNLDYILNSLIWDPSKYLNVWICDFASNYYSGNYDADPPKYILIAKDTLAGLSLEEVDDTFEPAYSKAADAGILINPLAIDDINDVSFERAWGFFYGLLETEYSASKWVDGDVDYCPDTYTYDLKYYQIEKYTHVDEDEDEEILEDKRIYYESYNIMDEYSSSISISYEQALRIRTVMENCPLRMMKK